MTETHNYVNLLSAENGSEADRAVSDPLRSRMTSYSCGTDGCARAPVLDSEYLGTVLLAARKSRKFELLVAFHEYCRFCFSYIF